MKLSRLVLLSGFLFLSSCDSAVKPSTINEGIMQTLNYYFNGRRSADISQLSKAFSKNARLEMVGENGKIIIIDRANYFERVEEKGKVKVKTQLLYLSIHGNIAMAQTRFEYENKVYLDYLTLLKSNQGWKITNKAFVKL